MPCILATRHKRFLDQGAYIQYVLDPDGKWAMVGFLLTGFDEGGTCGGQEEQDLLGVHFGKFRMAFFPGRIIVKILIFGHLVTNWV